MSKKKYIYWQDNDMWLGYLEEYPDYMTQGESLDELKENLKEIYSDLSAGHIPCVRRVDEDEIHASMRGEAYFTGTNSTN